MRPLLLSVTACILALGVLCAQNQGGGGGAQQVPVGQTFKHCEFPIYQDGKLKATVTAEEATGITLNRAETTDLKIENYDNGAVTTTVTSPKADLYVAERKMRTKNTVHIVRADMDATAQSCDFDLLTKKYLMRTNVKVILKNFDVSLNTKGGPPAASTNAPPAAPAAPEPAAPKPVRDLDALPESPGAYSDTNSAPISPSTPAKP